MKFDQAADKIKKTTVAPLAGAWIEISFVPSFKCSERVAPLAGAWIEIRRGRMNRSQWTSLPSRERGLKYKI